MSSAWLEELTEEERAAEEKKKAERQVFSRVQHRVNIPGRKWDAVAVGVANYMCFF